MDSYASPSRGGKTRRKLIALLAICLRARQNVGRIVREPRACDIDKKIGDMALAEKLHRLRPVAWIEPAAGMVPHCVYLAAARFLLRRVCADALELRVRLCCRARRAPLRGVDGSDERRAKPRLEVLVAVREKDVRHPPTVGRRQPRRVASGLSVPVDPCRHHLRLALYRDGALQDGRSLENRGRRSWRRVHRKVHSAPLPWIGSRLVARGTDANQLAELRRGGIEDDELAAPVAETAQGLDLVGGRRLETDEKGNLLLRELRAHIGGLHDFGGDVLVLKPAADVVCERGVVSRLMRDNRDGEEE